MRVQVQTRSQSPSPAPSRSRFRWERELLSAGVPTIAGVDEAGRGPLAGPVAASAVMLPAEWIRIGLPRPLRGLNDSKQLSPAAREDFHAFLVGNSEVRFAVVLVEVEEIDRINILRASHAAMERCLRQLLPAPAHVLIDGLPVPTLSYPQTALVGGDGLSYSIAAASVLAKVTRDRQMLAYDRQWPGYGFAAHKGYPTPEHRTALARLGPCPIHRRSFSPVLQMDLALDAGEAFRM